MTGVACSRAICVLGVHRSGTSTVTRGLNLLGGYLGEEKDLMRALPENPEGFWERLDIYYLQERLLAVLQRDWAATAPLPDDWQTAAEVQPLKDELASLVETNFAGRPLWLWKDPRTCLLLPLWREVLAARGIDLKVVFVVRSPLDIARSLGKRNGFTLEKGMGIWFNQTLAALQGCMGLDSIFLSYDRFLDDWETELKTCAAGLGIVWPDNEAGLREKMAPFVRRDLRHSVSGLEQLAAVQAPAPVVKLYQLMLEFQSGERRLHDAADVIGEILQEFRGYARLFDFDLKELAACRAHLEEAALSGTLPTVAALEKELRLRTEWAWKLDEEVKYLHEQVALLQKETAGPPPRPVAAEQQLEAVLNSMSWKITRPLRIIHGVLLKMWPGNNSGPDGSP